MKNFLQYTPGTGASSLLSLTQWWLPIISIVFFATPSTAQNTSISVSNGQTSISVEDGQTSIRIKDGEKTKISYNNGSKSFEIEYQGEITLSDDDKDIVAISDGGFIEIKKKAFGSKRKIIFESKRDGTIKKRYFVGRKEKPFIPSGKTWLANVLPEIIKFTGIGAEARVDRIYKKGGANAVLAEIESVEGDYVGSIYYGLLLDKDLDTEEIISLLEKLDDTIESDHYITDILQSHDDTFLENPRSTDAYINAVKSIQSDHYMSEVLMGIIDNKDITNNQVTSLLDISEALESDHYMSEVLRSLIRNRDLSEGQSTKLVRLIGNLDSDHYTTEVIKDLLDEKDINNEVMAIITSSLENIESDHYFTELVKAASRHDMEEATLSTLLEKIRSNIDSDHYRIESLTCILDEQDMQSEAAINSLINNISSISSDHYASELVRKIVEVDNITDAQLIRIMELVSDLGSDNSKAECLKRIAPKVDEDNTLLYKAYRKAARSIHSETYYGRVMRASD